ncbi:hypothetical protein CQY20_17795 [Mycolicibacterium agri]|uniref:Carboxypeptidase Q n=1 Tax=Mycolicibacterium agri TaxID=36811 RepID=A0A2A7MYS1_MYCAG|nr:M28 family metallopeptidase [Mycolicibacterium agri]PEG36806.1 hypothetical protein CQY20_17795 [Mycolicibacterium agri]GFG50711.1 hypothetical protein MAGR_21520 [Mycolicibacterium agri]
MSVDNLTADLLALCRIGGRLAGTPGETAAREYLTARLAECTKNVYFHEFSFSGRIPVDSEVSIVEPSPAAVPSIGLVNAPATPTGGLTAALVDLGRGAPADLERAPDLTGKAALVRHEYMFTSGTVHRRLKYQMLKERGATAMLVANCHPGLGPVAGGVGIGADDDMPAVGIDWESGERLRDLCATSTPIVRIRTTVEHRQWQPGNVLADIPGQTEEMIVVCAHYDGHPIAHSAIDNASGVIGVLETCRRLAPIAASLRRGIRVALFTVEEWGLQGSRRYLQDLDPRERQRITAAINLDSIVGHPRLCALTGGDESMEKLLRHVSITTGPVIRPVRVHARNSDHYNFAAEGIPAMRLIAGYDYPDSQTRFVLTSADRMDLVDIDQLQHAATAALRLVRAACEVEAWGQWGR